MNPFYILQDKYDFLSNFYPSVVEMDGLEYPTVEHAYQAAKTSDIEQRKRIRDYGKPGEAKRAGRRIKRPSNWFDYNLQVMEDLVRQKFTRYPELGEKVAGNG